MDRPQRRFVKRAAVFGGLWLGIGFALGTLTLLGPVRMLTSAMRRHAVSAVAEKSAVLVTIALLIIITTTLASLAMQKLFDSPTRLVKFGIPIVVILAAGIANWVWMQPGLLKASMGGEEELARFTFGPYPDEVRMVHLKQQGYTGVISLLHPAVVPFEPQLIATEEKAAKKAGMPLIHLPMLPWVSDNTKSINALRELVKKDEGRYYVHCYLGMDRVLIAKKLVEQNAPAGTVVAVNKGRSIAKVKEFERGKIVRVDATTWVTPFPTSDEFVRYVLGTEVEEVFALLDPQDPDQAKRIDEERKLLAQYSMPYRLIPMRRGEFDPVAILAAVNEVKKSPRKKIVHAFLGAETGRAPVAAAFVTAYKEGRPPLSPTIEGAELRAGEIELVKSNLATGPRPEKREFGSVLKKAGVREFICVDGEAAECKVDGAFAREYGMEYSRLKTADVPAKLQSGGPFYLYGPEASQALDLIE